jgi:hypothetical protein
MRGWVLVDGDDVSVREDVNGALRHVLQIVAGEQRNCQQSSKSHVRPVLLVSHALIANIEHVRIILMSG